MKQTQYRIREDGFRHRWLEYKGWIFWKPVPIPYYDLALGNDYYDKHKGYLSSGFEWFMKKYPDIRVYLREEYYPKQFELQDDAKKYWDNHDKKYITKTIPFDRDID